ncbi:MAG: type I restriction-modification system subunit M [Christensenellaceae bacterium]|jgi:type I restriction enzyme M protein|nr:type I restriction-modification system subunit M [Christensenellaceae bacterium]
MVDNRKETERTELHRAIWGIANDLRGSVDGWDFKQYVLGILFYRYISENLSGYINAGEREAGKPAFEYAKLPDSEAEPAREDLVATKGFFILPSELFENLRARASNDPDLNVTLENIFKHIEASAQGTPSEANFKGLFDDIDVNSNKLGATVAKRNEQIVKLLNGIGEMKLGNYKENTIDLFGDAYEYLMGMYASNAGKSGGEYYTPQEVSELLTRLTIVGKTVVNKVYDPACGSGSLLLKFAKILGRENVRKGFFGQEINLTTYNLCRINMFLHDIDYDKFDIAHGDTMLEPKHWDDEPFETIVSNPPYSHTWVGDGNPLLINDPRFSPAGVLAPKSKEDFAFIMHGLSWLAASGTAAYVVFPGILYRGGAEQKIRKYLIDYNFVDCVIQLPDNLFFGTSIATCIMVIRKGKSDNATLFIDASRECVKVTNSNKLTVDNIDKIVAAYTTRESADYFARLVPNSEIAQQSYNLSVSTYVAQEDKRETIDINALNAEIARIVARENVLRLEIDAIIADIEGG